MHFHYLLLTMFSEKSKFKDEKHLIPGMKRWVEVSPP